MTKLNKVGSNLEQDFNETEKAQARANIGNDHAKLIVDLLDPIQT